MNNDKEIWEDFNQSDIKKDNQVFKKAKNIEKTVTDHAQNFLFKKIHVIKEVRKKVLIWLGVILVTLFLVVISILLFRTNYQTSDVDDSRYYFEGMTGDIKTLNPLFISTQPEKAIEHLIFSSLYTYDQNGELKSDIAKNISISEDYKTYKITIKNNRKWSDGNPITAKDIKYSIQAYKNYAINSFTGQTFRGVSVNILSDYTVEFKLKSKYPAFNHLLTFSILPEHILSKLKPNQIREADFNYFPISSGDFVVNDFVIKGNGKDKITTVTLENNKKYHKNGLSKIAFSTYYNEERLASALSRKEINGALFNNSLLTNTNFDNLSSKYYQISAGVFAFLNNKSEVFKTKESRQAFRSLIDVDEIRRQYSTRYKTNVDFDFPMQKKYFNNNIKTKNKINKQEIDKILSKKIQYKNKKYYLNDKEVVIKIVSIKDSDYQLAAELLAQNLRNNNFKVDLELINIEKDKKSLNQKIFQDKKYDILVYELDFGSNFDVYSFWHSSQSANSGLNFSNYNNKIADRLLSTARVSADEKTRNAKYTKFVETWLNDCPAIGLYKKTYKYVHNKKVRTSMNNNRLIRLNDRYYDVLNWSAESKEVYKTP